MIQKLRSRYGQMTSQLILLIAFLLAPSTQQNTYGQLLSPQVLDLKCEHIYEIQQRYLNRHILYRINYTPNIESRTIDQFTKHLDGSKLYLLQSDVDSIKKEMHNLFGKLRLNDCSSLTEANKLLEKRMNERVAFVKKQLGSKFVFNPKVKFVLDPEKRERAKTLDHLNSFHKNYLQFQIANYLASDMSLEEAKKRVVRNYERVLHRTTETPERELWSSYIDSFARSLDPHSSYLAKDALEDFEIQMRLSLEGIGATLRSEDGFTVIEQLIPGGSAFESGKLKAKDKIIEVGQGEDGEAQNVIEMDLRDVVRLIRGKKGTQVKLTILRKDSEGSKKFKVVLTREKIKLEDEAAKITYFDKEVNKVKKKIALLTLPSFYSDNIKKGRSAADDMKKLIAEANEKKADSLVLDLSGNGGGSLEDAVKIAGLFFRVGNVVKQSRRVEEGPPLILADRDPAVDWSKPLVVLISRISASASEIVSGALKDYKRALIVGGDHTFGKGTVQSVEYLAPGLGAMKTTVGMFFTAGGKSTQHIGVASDVIMPSALSTDEIGEKNLDYSLPPKQLESFLSRKAYVAEGEGAWVPVSSDFISVLRERSLNRIKTNDDFKKLQKEIAKQKHRGSIVDVAEQYKEKKDLQKDKEKEASKQAKNSKDKSGTSTKVSDNPALNPDHTSINKSELDGDEDDSQLTREQRLQKYYKRPDVQEAINIALDMVLDLKNNDVLTVGAKQKKPDDGDSTN